MLAARAPTGYTPTGPAIAGALAYARQRLAAGSNGRVAVVLVTDGLPGGFIPGFPPAECTPSDIPGIGTLLAGAQGRNGTPPVLTFVIGVFAPGVAASTAQTNLDMLAASGGTSPAIIVDTGTDVPAALRTALGRVSSSGRACSYQLPVSATGTLDLSKVNVQIARGTAAPVVVGRTLSKAACDTRGGWYYEMDGASPTPTGIGLCAATCQQTQNDPSGRVDITLGCPTILVD
jgi:hypothetical protein